MHKFSKPCQLMLEAFPGTLSTAKAILLLKNTGGLLIVTRILIVCRIICQTLWRFSAYILQVLFDWR